LVHTFGELDYDHFLAEVSQTVAVDVSAAGAALARLVGDEALRSALGAAARQRALDLFAWPRIIAAYEAIWRDQEMERQDYARLRARTGGSDVHAHFPPPEWSFAGYPTRWLDAESHNELAASAWAPEVLEQLLALPLTNHAANRRVADSGLLRQALARAAPSCSVAALFLAAGVDQYRARATLRWMLKYDLIRVIPDE
jgi:hypothetical protein